MSLVVLGVNYKTAPVAIRERLAFGDDLPQALTSLKSLTDGVAIVSTCNRSEIYAYITPNTAQSKPSERLTDWLVAFKGLQKSQILPFLYSYEANRALTHWLRVAVGLDSMILGEPQILGQIKQAVMLSHQMGVIGTKFDWLTQKIFSAAKVVRHDTKLGEQAVSLGFAAAKLVTQIFDDPTKQTLLIVAAGEMNRLVAQNIASLGIQKVLICNRSMPNAQKLADELSAQAYHDKRHIKVRIFGLDALVDCLSCADIVSSCSGSMHTLIDKAMIKSAMKARRQKALLCVDLAVPRDITPDIGAIDNVYLYSVDDLSDVVQDNIDKRKQAALDAEVLVSQLVASIEEEWQIQQAGQFVKAYNVLLHAQKDKLLELAQKQLANGVDAVFVLEQLANKLTNVLAHPQTHLIRQTAAKQDDKTLQFVADNLLNAYRQK